MLSDDPCHSATDLVGDFRNHNCSRTRKSVTFFRVHAETEGATMRCWSSMRGLYRRVESRSRLRIIYPCRSPEIDTLDLRLSGTRGP